MKILITGGSGMVGKNLLEHQELDKHQILAPSSKELNLLSQESTFNYLNNCKPDLIIHAAGRVGGIQSNIKNPVSFLTENLQMGLNLLLTARDLGVKKVLNLGSSCMYPRNATNPLKEEMVLKGELEPTNEGYAIAKCAVSRLCDYINREEPVFKYKTIIPCNLYGRWDKFDPIRSHLIPSIIVKMVEAKKNNSKVIIWGDGTARREFMYAEDLADFIGLAINNFDQLDQLTNVGLGFDYSIQEYYQAVADVISYQGQFDYDLSKPTGMKQKLVDTSKVKQLNWKAKTSLEEGIKKTISFYYQKLEMEVSQ